MSEINKDNFYHIYILLKDKIRFESELIDNDISFHYDESQIQTDNSIRYHLLEKDKIKIDKILIENKIITNDETTRIIDYRDNSKINKVYVLFVIVIVLVILIIDYVK